MNLDTVKPRYIDNQISHMLAQGHIRNFKVHNDHVFCYIVHLSNISLYIQVSWRADVSFLQAAIAIHIHDATRAHFWMLAQAYRPIQPKARNGHIEKQPSRPINQSILVGWASVHTSSSIKCVYSNKSIFPQSKLLSFKAIILYKLSDLGNFST